jgi:hypothetical protein
MNSKLILKSGLTAIILTLLSFTFSRLFGSTLNIAHYEWELVSNLLILIVLGNLKIKFVFLSVLCKANQYEKK